MTRLLNYFGFRTVAQIERGRRMVEVITWGE